MDPERFEEGMHRLDRIEALLLQIEANSRETLSRHPTTTTEQVVLLETEPKGGNNQSNRERPRRVFLRCNVLALRSVDCARNTFHLEAHVTARWKEPDLDGVDDDDVHWSELWEPRIFFTNAVQLDKCTKTYSLLHDPADIIPHVVQSFYVHGTFSTHMNLSEYPFDYQVLPLHVSCDLTAADIQFIKDMNWRDTVTDDKFLGSDTWELQRYVVTDTHPYVDNEPDSIRRPLFAFQCHVKRKVAPYCWNTFFFTCMILLISFCAFAVTPHDSDSGTRQMVCLLLMLTLLIVRIFLSLVGHAPTSRQPNYLDRHMICILVFLAAMIIETSIASDIYHSWKFELPIGLLMTLVLVGWHVYFVLMLIVKLKKRHSFFVDTLRQYQAVCGEILRSQGERPQMVEVKRKKKRFSRKAMRESFRKLFSDESEEESENKSFRFKLPRRKKKEQPKKTNTIEQEDIMKPSPRATRAFPESDTSSDDERVNIQPKATSTPAPKI